MLGYGSQLKKMDLYWHWLELLTATSNCNIQRFVVSDDATRARFVWFSVFFEFRPKFRLVFGWFSTLCGLESPWAHPMTFCSGLCWGIAWRRSVPIFIAIWVSRWKLCWMVSLTYDSHAKFQAKEGKTARYSGHCHRNLPLGSCLVKWGAAKSEGAPPKIEFEKS